MMRPSALAAAAAGAAVAGLVLASAAPAQFAVAGVARAAAAQHSDAGSFKLPYTDPDQAGLLTLCNTKLQPITQGSIYTKPFVWRVVSSVPAITAFRVKGATAALFLYQPRQYTPAGAWSGVTFTPGSEYSNYQHPMVQLTPIDEPLSYMTEQYPPLWDHLIEIRVYIGGPDLPFYERAYGAADIQVIGNTWKLVEGGHASCTDGTAVSHELLLGMPGSSGTPKPNATGSGDQSGTPRSGSAATTGSSSSPAAGAGSDTGTSGTSAADRSSVSGVAPAAIGVGVLVVVLLAAVALWRNRRQRRAGL